MLQFHLVQKLGVLLLFFSSSTVHSAGNNNNNNSNNKRMPFMYWEPLQGPNGPSGSPQFKGQYDRSDLEILCQGDSVRSLRGVVCTSETDCDAKVDCVVNGNNCGRLDVFEGKDTKCGDMEAASVATCQSVTWPGVYGPLKHRLDVGLFYCLLKDGRNATYRHFIDPQHIKPDKNVTDVDLQIFKEHSSVSASESGPDTVINVFANQPIFLKCRVEKMSTFLRPSAPIRGLQANGDTFLIDTPPTFTDDDNWFSDVFFDEILVNKNMSGVVCTAQKSNNFAEVVERRLMFNVETPNMNIYVSLPDGTKIQIGSQFMGCTFASLYHMQIRILFATFHEHNVMVGHGSTITSITTFWRLQQIVEEMNLNFTCIEVPENMNDTMRKQFHLFAKFAAQTPATIRQNVKDDGGSVLSMKTVAVRCQFSGEPIPTVMWLRNGKVVLYSAPQKERKAHSQGWEDYFSIMDIYAEDFDDTYEAVYPNYTCRVSNYLRTEERSFFTETEPKIKKIDSSRDYEEIHWSTDGENDDGDLICPFTGGPTTKVKWLHNNNEIDGSRLKTISAYGPQYAESILTLKLRGRKVNLNATRGKYTCSVTNSFGRDFREFRVTIDDSGKSPMAYGGAQSQASQSHTSVLAYIIGPIVVIVIVLVVVVVVQYRKIRSLGLRFRSRTNACSPYERIILEDQPRQPLEDPARISQVQLRLSNPNASPQPENDDFPRARSQQTSSFSTSRHPLAQNTMEL